MIRAVLMPSCGRPGRCSKYLKEKWLASAGAMGPTFPVEVSFRNTDRKYLNSIVCDGNFPVFSVFENAAGASLVHHPKKTQPAFLVGPRN